MTDSRLRLSVPAVSARVSMESVVSVLARLIACGAAVTRADLVRLTGLARSTVTAALDVLEQGGVVCNLGTRAMTGRGRPAEELGLNSSYGIVMVADLGVRTARLSIHDTNQNLLGHLELPLKVADGPETVIAEVTDRFREMLAVNAPALLPLVLVIGLPGPVDTSQGLAVKPPIMPGWDGFPVAQHLGTNLGCPVLCDNDVNLRALGEARVLPPDQTPLLYIKVSTGIGGGLVTGRGDLFHGADGSAGDIGHVHVPGGEAVLCTCGNFGCIEAVASVPAILRRLEELANPEAPVARTPDELAAALRSNDKVTVGLVREAASQLGEVVADLVHFYNPARIVVGGALSVPSDDLLAGIRAVVYRRALPLATRNLVITSPVLGEWSGTAGGLVIGTEYALTPEGLAKNLSKALRTAETMRRRRARQR